MLVEVDDGDACASGRGAGRRGSRRPRRHAEVCARRRAAAARATGRQPDDGGRRRRASCSTAEDGERARASHASSGARRSALECVVRVRDEDELERALEHVDPRSCCSRPTSADDDAGAARPAARAAARRPGRQARDRRAARRRVANDVEELERAGVDAVLVAGDVAALVGDAAGRLSSPPDARSAPALAGAGYVGRSPRRIARRSQPLLRLVGVGATGCRYPLAQPGRGEHRPARLGRSSHGGRLDPGWYDYPSPPVVPRSRRASWRSTQPSYGAARVVAVALGVGGVAAAWWLGRRAVRHARRHRRRRRRRRRDDPRRVLAHGRHGRAADARRHRARSRSLVAGPARVGGRRRRPRRVGEVPGALARRAARRRRLGQWRRARCRGGARPSARSRSRARSSSSTPARPGTTSSRVQRLARDGLARLRGRPGDAARVRSTGSGRRSARSSWSRSRGSASRSSGGPRDRSRARSRSRPSTALTLLPLDAHFDRYVLPLVPVLAVLAGRAARRSPSRPRRRSSCRSAGRSTTPRRSPAPTPRLDAAAWIDAHVPRDDRIAADPSTLPLAGRRRRPARAARARPAVRPATATSSALRARGRPVAASRRARRRPRARRRRTLPARGSASTRELDPAAARVRDRPSTTGPSAPGSAGLPHLPLSRWTSRGVDAASRSASRSSSPGAVLLGRRDRREPRARADFGSSLFVWGALIGVVLDRALDRLLGSAARSPTGCRSPYLLRRRDRARRGARARDPARRRVGARAGRRAGIPARASTRSSPRSSSSGRRASCSRRSRRSPSGSPRARSSGSAARRAASSRSRPPAASRDVRDGVLAHARARHRPGARGRRARPARRGRRRRAARAPLAARRRARRRRRRGARSRSVALAPDKSGHARAAPRRRNWSPLYRERDDPDAAQARPAPRSARSARLHGPRGTDTRYHRLFVADDERLALPPLRQLVPERHVPRRPVPDAVPYTDYLNLGLAYNPDAKTDPLHRSRRRLGAEAACGATSRTSRCTTVELDPDVVDAAYKWFELPRDDAARGRGRRRPAVSRTARRALGRDRDRRVLLRLDPVPPRDPRVPRARAGAPRAGRRRRHERDRRADRRELAAPPLAREDLPRGVPDGPAPPGVSTGDAPVRTTSAT